MRTLIYTATYGAGPRPETIESVRMQVCDGQWEYEIGWHNPYGEGDIANVTAQMERARMMALEGPYDAMLTVEHDMMIPPDSLQRLWDTGAPVAYGAYLFRHGARVLNAYEKYPTPSTNPGESLSFKPRLLRKARKQEIVEVSGIGFGCTLIRRHVLTQIPFRHRDSERNGTDTMFAMDCLKAGIKQVAHFGVLCGHWDGYEWLMPFSEQDPGHGVLVVALQNVTVRGERGESVPMKAGQTYRLPRGEATELRHAGYVQIIAADGA